MTAILPLPDPPRIRGGLDIVATPLLGRNGELLPTSEWAMGVERTNLPHAETFFSSLHGGTWGDPDDGDLKPSSESGARNRLLPGSVGAVFECQMNAPNTTLGDIPRAEGTSFMDRAYYSLVAEAISTPATPGIDCDPDAQITTLPGVAQLPDGYVDNAPGTIEGVMHGLLDGVCAYLHTDPVFHVARAFMPHFFRRGIVHWDEVGGFFRMGPHRVSFDCYANVGPAGTTTAGDGSEVWIYASTPIELATADPDADSVSAVRTQLQNIYRVRVEREFIAVFDTEGVYAAKALVG